MSEKYNIIEGRIQHKNDIEANWKKAVNFIPLEAEIVVYLPDEGHKTARIKVGDGITNVNDLPFSQEIDGALWQTGNSVTNNTGVAFGGSTQAGILGYYFSRFKATQNTLTQIWSVEVDLSTTQCKGLYKSENTSTLFTLTAGANDVVTPPTSTIPYSEGDVLTLVCDYKLENVITVTSVSGNTVYGTWTSEEKITNAGITSGNEDEYSIYCIAKPKAGEVPLGYYAHAEGWKTQALEKGSHAEGRQTIAYGQFSHAEGRQTEAGYAAHSEGYNTKAQGDCAHAEGYGTNAADQFSHAEGGNTNAASRFSHAEGYGTNAAGEAAHAEGGNTNAVGQAAHAEGENTTADSQAAHAEGYGTNATGWSAHAEGYNTKAIGHAAHAEGQDNISGSKAFTIKNLNKNTDGSGTYILDSVQGLKVGMVYSAHVYYSDKGWSTQGENYGKITGIDESTRTVTVDKLFCEYTFGTPNSYIDSDGYDNEFNTFRIITNPELGTRTIGAGTHAEGMSSEALSKAAHAEGYNTLAQGSYSHAEGQSTTAAFAAHAEGKITKASGFHSHAEGHGSTSSGEMSHAEGSRSTASGEASHAEGTYTTAAGNYSHTEGDLTTASGEAAHAEGFKSVAKGKYSHAEGSGTTAAGSHSHVGGSDSKASYSGSFVHGTGLNDNEENQTVIGKYNASAPGATFVVGNGTTSSNRSNAFVIYNDGSADIKNLKSMNVSSTSYDTKVKGFKIFEINSSSLPQDYRLRSYILETWAKVDQVESLLGVSAGTLPTEWKYYPVNDNNFNIENDLHAIIYSNNGTTINLGKVQGFYPTSSDWSKVAVVFDYRVPQFEDFICDNSHVSHVLVFTERPDVGSYENLIPQGKSVIGDENKSAALNGLVVGTGLRSYNEGELSIGTYNDSDGDNLFSIGNGTSDEDRSNVFAVKKNGTANISNKLLISSEQYDSTIHGFGIFAVPGHGVDDFIYTNNLVEYRNNTYVIQTWAMGQQVDSLFGKDIRKDATFTSHTLYELDDFGIEDLHAIVIDNKDGTTIDVGRVIGFSTNVAYNESQNLDGGANIRYSWSKLNVTFENAVPELNDFHYTEEWDATCNRYTLVFVEKSDAGNSISSHNSLIVGSDNRSSSSNSACIGTGLRTYGTDEEVVVGRYNSLKSGSLFTIGNGTSDENRSNAFEVDDDGNTYINNNLYIGGTGNSTIAGDLHIDGTLTLTKDNKEVATIDQIPNTNNFATKDSVTRIEKNVDNLTATMQGVGYYYSENNDASMVKYPPENALPFAQVSKLDGLSTIENNKYIHNGIASVISNFNKNNVVNFLNFLPIGKTERFDLDDGGWFFEATSTSEGKLFIKDPAHGPVGLRQYEYTLKTKDADILPPGEYKTVSEAEYTSDYSYDNSVIHFNISYNAYDLNGTLIGEITNNGITISKPFKILQCTVKIGAITASDKYSDSARFTNITLDTHVSYGGTLQEFTEYQPQSIYNVESVISKYPEYCITNNYIDVTENKLYINTVAADFGTMNVDEWGEGGDRSYIYKGDIIYLQSSNLNWYLQGEPNFDKVISWTHSDVISDVRLSSYGTGCYAVFIEIPTSIFSTLEEADEWLKDEAANGTPVQLLYSLQVPETIDVSNELSEDNFIEVSSGAPILFYNKNNLNLPNTIEYQVKVGE